MMASRTLAVRSSSTRWGTASFAVSPTERSPSSLGLPGLEDKGTACSKVPCVVGDDVKAVADCRRGKEPIDGWDHNTGLLRAGAEFPQRRAASASIPGMR